MNIKAIIVLLLIYVVMMFFVDRWLRKKFNIEESGGFIYRRVNQLHVEIDTAITIMALIDFKPVTFFRIMVNKRTSGPYVIKLWCR